MEGYRRLIASILLRAIRDWKSENGEMANALGFNSYREELETFFQSNQCQTWFNYLSIDFDAAKSRIGIP